MKRRETLLRVRRENSCVFTLTLILDPDGGERGITFTEFYDYGPLGDDPGREYGYSVHAPYDTLDALANHYAPDAPGPAADRLAEGLRTALHDGDRLGLKGSQHRVLEGFELAGVPATTSIWSWIND
ncbi:hypothetical protein E1218_30095 [Kribbella turkmenica]|uniref:Uncharacterized protein n=1 Tax=Kribbella turkmenica TaxID=2530375 RepID=A0A4R4WPK8_9ACTN|nr:hypothetical protein [Kribbella turkmenica]TDD16270.1 hypothetical protein E1218_30095 [Kribbella turkmenica]